MVGGTIIKTLQQWVTYIEAYVGEGFNYANINLSVEWMRTSMNLKFRGSYWRGMISLLRQVLLSSRLVSRLQWKSSKLRYSCFKRSHC